MVPVHFRCVPSHVREDSFTYNRHHLINKTVLQGMRAELDTRTSRDSQLLSDPHKGIRVIGGYRYNPSGPHHSTTDDLSLIDLLPDLPADPSP